MRPGRMAVADAQIRAEKVRANDVADEIALMLSDEGVRSVTETRATRLWMDMAPQVSFRIKSVRTACEVLGITLEVGK